MFDEEKKVFHVEQNAFGHPHPPLNFYPDCPLAFSAEASKELQDTLNLETDSDTVRATFQSAATFLQTLHNETVNLVTKAFHKSAATKTKLASLSDGAAETGLNEIHDYYSSEAARLHTLAYKTHAEMKEFIQHAHLTEDSIRPIPCSFCGQLDSVSNLTDQQLLLKLKQLAVDTADPEEQTALQALIVLLEKEFHQGSYEKPTRMAQIKKRLTRAIHHRLTDFIETSEQEEETDRDPIQLDYQLRLDRQLWLLRALLQQNVLSREFTIVKALHELLPGRKELLDRLYKNILAISSPLFVKEMSDQNQKILRLEKKMMHIYENIQHLKKNAVEVLVEVKSLDMHVPELISEINKLWAGLEYARQHTALSTSLKPRPIAGSV